MRQKIEEELWSQMEVKRDFDYEAQLRQTIKDELTARRTDLIERRKEDEDEAVEERKKPIKDKMDFHASLES